MLIKAFIWHKIYMLLLEKYICSIPPQKIIHIRTGFWHKSGLA